MCADVAGRELVVEFRQRFTVEPPEEIDDPRHAEEWFWGVCADMAWDVLDPADTDNFDVVGVRWTETADDREELVQAIESALVDLDGERYNVDRAEATLEDALDDTEGDHA